MKAKVEYDKNDRPIYVHPETGERLVGTNRFIDKIFPFTEIVSPAALPWAEKSKRRELKFGELTQEHEFADPTNEFIEKINKTINCLYNIDATFGKFTRQATGDGQYAEEYCTSKFEDREFEEYDEYGNKREETERAVKLGDKLIEALHSLGDITPLGDQLALVSKDGKEVGKLDYLVRDNKTGGLILIDFKTGSPMVGDKLKKLMLQLASYADMVEMEFGEYPEKVLGILAYEKENRTTDEWEYDYQIIDVKALNNTKTKKYYDLKQVNKTFNEFKKVIFELEKQGIKNVR